MNELFIYRFNYFVNKLLNNKRITNGLVKHNLLQKRFINKKITNNVNKINNKKSFKTINNNETRLEVNTIIDNTIKSDSNILKTLTVDQLAFRVTVTEMQRFLANNKMNVKNGRTCLSLKCPFCHLREDNKPLHSINNAMDSTLFINKTTSNYICYSCERSGNWTTFVELISSLNANKVHKKDLVLPKTDLNIFPNEKTLKEMNEILKTSLTFDKLSKEEIKLVYNKFKLNGISEASLKYFDICVSEDLNELIFPFKSCYDKSLITGIKVMQFTEENNNSKISEKLIPCDMKLSIFGLNQQFVNDCSFDELVITQTPIDAIAVTQETKISCVSFPSHGMSAQIPPEVLPFFERFKKITVWFGNSVQDWNSAKSLSRKLDEKRCHIVCSNDQLNPHKTPLNAIQNKVKLIQYLESSQAIAHSAITTFRSLRNAILCEIKDPLCSGVLWNRFPELGQHLKGHRSGELTVFTGPTGCGKTTFMSEYSLDLCIQGVRTLWGSFEVKNVRLAKMMLNQFAEKAITKHLDEFDHWADKLEELPLYFMTFHGQESIKNVLAAMSHAVYVHDIKHVIIDNIQFMLGCDSSHKFDRFWQQDLVLNSFRKFATHEDCHVTLVIHPRKEEDMDELNNNSIFGGVKASQEADNILILQNKWLPIYKCHKYIQITKNRWDGDLGKVPLWFDKESLSYSPQSRRSTNLMYTQINNESDSQTTDISNTNANKPMEFARVKCKSEQDFDDFRLQ